MRLLLFLCSLATLFACTTPKVATSKSAHENAQMPKETVDESRLLTLDRIFSGEFSPAGFGGVQWKDAEHFIRIEQTTNGPALMQYSGKTGEKRTLISSEQLTPAGAVEAIRPAKYFWSADQSKLLIFTNTRRVWRENTRGDYWVLDLKKETLTQVGADKPEASLMFAKFSPDGSQVAYVSEHDIYVESLADGTQTRLTHDGSEDIINGTFDWAYEEELFCKDGFRWSPDGKKIAFWKIDASDIRDYWMINNTDSLYPFIVPVEYPKAGTDPSSAHIGVADISSQEIRWMDIPGDPRQNYLPRLQWIADNEILATQLSRKQNNYTLWRCNAANGQAEKFYSERDDAWVDVVHMDVTSPWEMLDLPRIGDRLARLTEKDGWRHLYLLPLNGDKPVLATPGEYDVARYYLLDLPDGTAYINASPENPTQRYLYRVNLDGSGKKRITPTNYSGINQYDIAPGGNFALHTHSSATVPTSVHLISLPDHQVIKTFADNGDYRQQLTGIDMPSVEFFKVTTEDGVEMDGRMYKPRDFDPAKKYPVIFNVYGEPAGQTAVDRWSGFLWPAMLTQQGYLYITMDNRGQPSLKGRAWRKSIYRKIGVLNSRDQAMAAKEILKWPYTDPERVSVWGWSGGGSMTLNLLFRYPEIYQTGISVAPVANQLYYDNIYQERYMGLPSENLEDFIEGSPITYAKNLQGDLLLVHGTADDNVHYQNAEALINELVKHNRQFDLMSYPNRSHGIWEGAGTTRHLYEMMTNYLLEHCEPGAKTESDEIVMKKARS